MKLKDPRITVQNTDSGEWQVTAEQLISGADGLESITFTVLVPRSDKSLPELTQQAAQRAVDLLMAYLAGRAG